MRVARLQCFAAVLLLGQAMSAAIAEVPPPAPNAPAFVVCSSERGESRFAHYSGYRKEYFTEYRIDSMYVTGAGGARVAISVVRPARAGNQIEERLGAVVMPSVYGRAVILDGKAESTAEQSRRLPRGGRMAIAPATDSSGDLAPQVAALVVHGFAVVVVDLPGRGSSFGGDYGYVDTRKRQAIWDVVNWIVTQTWSNGRVGAAGLSWNGALTLFAAFEGAPRALVAAFPESPGLLTGGTRSGWLLNWEARWLFGVAGATEKPQPGSAGWVIPVHKAHSAMLVDGDVDGSLARQALAEQDDPSSLLRAQLEAARLLATPTYPGAASAVSESGYAEWAPLIRGLASLRRSHVAVYLAVGAYDTLGFDQSPYAVLQADSGSNTRVMVHAAGHGLRRFSVGDVREQHAQLTLQTEMVRWFDAWLYGVSNGIGSEPRVHLPVLDTNLIDGVQRQGVEYIAAEGMRPTDTALKLYFAANTKPAVWSHFDGVLRADPAATRSEARLEQRWVATPPQEVPQSTRIRSDGQIRYGDLAWRDRQGIAFTSAPLIEDVIVVGRPRVTLQVTSSASHALLYVYLEEIDERGQSDYVAEGFVDTRFREGSKRAAAWDAPDIAALLAGEAVAVPLETQPREVILPLSATYVRFNKGHRIRVAIHSGDTTTLWTPVAGLGRTAVDPSETHTISLGHANGESILELPVLSQRRFEAWRVDGPRLPGSRRGQ